MSSISIALLSLCVPLLPALSPARGWVWGARGYDARPSRALANAGPPEGAAVRAETAGAQRQVCR